MNAGGRKGRLDAGTGRRAHARLLLSEVAVTCEAIAITRRKSVLARFVSTELDCRGCSFLFCTEVAHPTGFEPVTSAFGEGLPA